MENDAVELASPDLSYFGDNRYWIVYFDRKLTQEEWSRITPRMEEAWDEDLGWWDADDSVAIVKEEVPDVDVSRLIRYIHPKEFHAFGYLQELNRRFLHPLGLALEVTTKNAEVNGFGGVWDYRGDDDGIRYEGEYREALAEKYTRVQQEWHRRKPARILKLRYMVQPVGEHDRWEGLPVLLAGAAKQEFSMIEADDPTWIKMAQSMLDKLMDRICEEPFDPADVSMEELQLLDLVLYAQGFPDRPRVEAVHQVIDERDMWCDRAEVAESAIGAIEKLHGLDEAKKMREIASSALSTIAGIIGG